MVQGSFVMRVACGEDAVAVNRSASPAPPWPSPNDYPHNGLLIDCDILSPLNPIPCPWNVIVCFAYVWHLIPFAQCSSAWNRIPEYGISSWGNWENYSPKNEWFEFCLNPQDQKMIKLIRCIAAPRVPFSHSLLVAAHKHNTTHCTNPLHPPTPSNREILIISLAIWSCW